MKRIVLTMALFFLSIAGYAQSLPDSALYFGQTPPGEDPKKFDLPVDSGYFPAERIAISSDGREIYYGEVTGYGDGTKGKILSLRYTLGKWSGPFTIVERAGNPALSVKNDLLFLGGAWFCTRTGSGLGSPRLFWKTTHKIHYLQQTNSGKYYLLSNPSGETKEQTWCTLSITTTDTTIESLGTPPNVPDNGMDFYIARDESYIILVLKPNKERKCGGYADLFISFRKNDNSWTMPKSLGPAINIDDSADGRWGPYVTSDNRFLFYSHGKSAATSGINWVRFDTLLERLRVR